MSEIANMGKMVSLFFALLLYTFAWMWSVDHSKDCNRNARWEVLVARAFIGLHIGVLGAWFIWSWKH